MDTRTRLLVSGIAAAAAVLALAVCGLQVDRYELGYADVFEARAAEATDREWVPDWLPEQASDIRTVHDTNGTAALLRADLPADGPRPGPCTPAGSIAEPSITASWFPPDAIELGDPLQCDDWVGVRTADTLLLWRP